MTAAGRILLAQLALWGVLLLLAAGWAASGALAEEVPAPTVPGPTTVALDPVPQPPAAQLRPDPAPRPKATTRPAPAPAPRASSQPSVVTPSRVAPRPAARELRSVRLAKLRAAAKAKAAKAAKVRRAKAKAAQAAARAKAAAAKANARPVAGVAGVARVASASSRLAQPTVTVESAGSDDQLFVSGIAFLAGLLIPVGLVAAVVLIRRQRPRASGTTTPTYPAPASPQLVSGGELRRTSPPPAVVETEQRPPAVEPEESQPDEPGEAPVAEPIMVAAEEWAGWEFCEIDWWRGYVKAHFFARATTPGETDYVVRESSMFRWRGNGVPDATPAITAAHEQLIERLRAEGWEDDPGTSTNWYAQTFRRQRDPEALPR